MALCLKKNLHIIAPMSSVVVDMYQTHKKEERSGQNVKLGGWAYIIYHRRIPIAYFPPWEWC